MTVTDFFDSLECLGANHRDTFSLSSEIAHGLLHAGKIGKRSRELLNDLLHLNDLTLVHNADQQLFVVVRKAAHRGKLSHAVVERAHERLRKLLRRVGDDLKFDRFLEALQHSVADLAGDIAVKQAEDHRLDLEIIHEVGGDRDKRIDGENDPQQVNLRMVVMHPRSDQIRAAGGGIALHHNAVGKAADHTGRDRRENRARPVLRMVCNARKVDLGKNNEHDGKNDREERGTNDVRSVHDAVCNNDQRDVKSKDQVTGFDAGQVLDDRCDARKTRRRKLVGIDKQRLGKRKSNGA